MGTKITMGFDLESPQYIDSRQEFETIAEMEASDTSSFPDGFMTFCKEDKTHYTLDKEANLWDKFSGYGGGGGGGNNTAPLVRIDDLTETMYADGDEISISYYVTDAEGGKMSVQYYINDELVEETAIRLGKNEWKIGVLPKSPKPYNLMIVVTDQGELSGTDYINITVGQLEITSNFNDSIDYTLNEDIIVFYTVGLEDFTGAKVYRTLNGKQEFVDIIKKNNEWNLGKLEKGVHEIRLRVTKGNMQSNELVYKITVLDSLGLYMSSMFEETTATPNDRIEIDFKISMQNETLFKTWCQIDDNAPEVLLTNIGTNYWTVGYLELGQHTLRMWSKTRDESISGDNELQFDILVSEGEYTPEPPVVDSSLACWFDAKGKSNNNEESRITWEDKSGNNTQVKLHNLNYRSNGWINDELVLNGEAYCEIEYKPFKEVMRNGITIDVQFRNRNVGDITGRVISCEQKDSPYNGIYVDTMDSSLKIGGAEIKSAITEEEVTRITYVLDRSINYMFIYVNAVICSLVPLAESDITGFLHNDNIYLNAKTIMGYGTSIGSFGDCSIMNLRVYTRPLHYEEVLQNHISDMKLEDQKPIKDKNYPARNEGLPIMIMTGEVDRLIETSSKGVKVPLDIEFKAMGRTDVQSFSATNVETKLQGTSTLVYPVKNFKIDFGDPRQIRDVWAPMDKYTLKADFMDSTHSNNLGCAKFVEANKTSEIIVDGKVARIAIDGFPMLVYSRSDMSVEPKFIGIYNFNVDKGGDEEWCLDEDNEKHLFYIGGLNYAENGNTDFGTAVGFMNWDNDAIARDWECEFAGPIDNDDKSDHFELSRLIKWVATTNDKETWKREVGNYLNVDYTIDYYLNALVLGMVDSLGKNLRLITYDAEVWYPTYYDMDTLLGLDNSGAEKFAPDIEFDSYNTSESLLWQKMITFMYDEIYDVYVKKRMQTNVYSVENIMKYFGEEVIDKIGEIYFNKETIEKYIPQGTEYLSMCHGNRKGSLKRWIKERLTFVDSLFEVGGEYGKDIIARVGLGANSKATFGIQAYSSQYVRVQFGGKTDNFWYGKVGKDKMTTVELEIPANDLEIMISSANEIMKVDGFNKIQVNHIKLNNALRLTDLDVSNNATLQNLAFDVPEGSIIKRYLQSLKFKNCTGLLASSKLDLRECNKLKYLDGSDSSIATVDFSVGGSLKTINLSNTNLVNFNLDGHEYLQSVNLSGCFSLNTFTLKNCNRIKEISLTNSTITGFELENCNDIEKIDISGSYRVTTLRLPYLPNLKTINISNISSQVSVLDLTNSPNIETIIARNCAGLKIIKLSNKCTSLKTLDLAQTDIRDIIIGNGAPGNGVDLTKFDMDYINFSNCPSVVTIKLKKVTFRDESSNIFNNCTKLTRIDGEIILSGACSDTFYNCSELIQFPTIKFNSNVKSLYRTFSNCSRITMATVKEIFKGCLNLVTANETFSNCLGINGELPEDLFANNEHLEMLNYTFSNCGLIGTLPENLFENNPELLSLEYTFNQNKKLVGSIPQGIFAHNEKLTTIKAVFYACGLTGNIPGRLFINNPELKDCSYSLANNELSGEIPGDLFEDCAKITNMEYMLLGNAELSGELPEQLFDDCIELRNISYMFNSCPKLGENTLIPEGLFKNNINLLEISGFFSNKKFNGQIPAKLFENNFKISTINEVFLNCANLTGAIPENLFLNCTVITSAMRCFSGCEKIETIPGTLFKPFKSKLQYVQEAFSNCIGLLGQFPEDIINYSHELSNASGLFYGCSETIIPIPSRIFEGCVNLKNLSGAFSGCKKLTGEIPENLFKTLISLEDVSNIFYNCYLIGDKKPLYRDLFTDNIKLKNVNGTFLNCQAIGGDDIIKVNDIPEGLFRNCKLLRTTNSLFYGCVNLNGKIPFALFENCNELVSIGSTFNGCFNLTGEIPEDLYKGCSKIVNLDYAFAECNKLSYLPPKLFEDCKSTLNKNVSGTFRNCYSLTGYAIPFWNGYNVTSSFECYKSCTGLEDYESIQSTYK